jgi:hypothetical protein
MHRGRDPPLGRTGVSGFRSLSPELTRVTDARAPHAEGQLTRSATSFASERQFRKIIVDENGGGSLRHRRDENGREERDSGPEPGGWSHSKPACSVPASSWGGDSYHPNGGSAEQLKLEVSQRFGAASVCRTAGFRLKEPVVQYGPASFWCIQRLRMWSGRFFLVPRDSAPFLAVAAR